MRRPVRLLLTALAAVAAVGALFAASFVLPAPAAEGLARRDLTVGVLALGVLALAAYGFDLRDWF